MERHKIGRAVTTVAVMGTALIALFLTAGLSPANAQVVPPNFGDQIVCLVYHDLNDLGPPIPVLTAIGCAATSTPSGGGNLEVIKIVNGGTSLSSDFEIHVMSGGSDIAGSPQVGSPTGTTYIGIAPGSYTISETGSTLPDYTASFSGNCNASGSVILAAGASSVCTLTNTFSGSGGGAGPGQTVTGTLGGGTVQATSTLTGSVGATSTLSGTVSSGSTLSGTVGSGNSLTGTVTSAPSSNDGGGGGGGGGGGNGPIAGSFDGGGGPISSAIGTPAGQVLGASTGAEPSLPGIPNTGAGGNATQNLLELFFSGSVALGTLFALGYRNSRKTF